MTGPTVSTGMIWVVEKAGFGCFGQHAVGMSVVPMGDGRLALTIRLNPKFVLLLPPRRG
jgi:hypothetical protein